jgi:hypothetical protein
MVWSLLMGILLQDKGETQRTSKKSLRRVQNEFNSTIKKIRSDHGIEFKNIKVENFLE